MRLIDADALVAEIVRIDDLRKLSTATIGRALDAVPTIDAIPVEWLREYTKIGLTPNGLRLTDGNERLVINRILYEWQMEQEAQDGRI